MLTTWASARACRSRLGSGWWGRGRSEASSGRRPTPFLRRIARSSPVVAVEEQDRALPHQEREHEHLAPRGATEIPREPALEAPGAQPREHPGAFLSGPGEGARQIQGDAHRAQPLGARAGAARSVAHGLAALEHEERRVLEVLGGEVEERGEHLVAILRLDQVALGHGGRVGAATSRREGRAQRGALVVLGGARRGGALGPRELHVALRGRRRRHVEVVRHRGELDGGDALGARQLLEVDGDAGRQGRGAGATIESIEQPRGALVERTAPTEGLLDARPGCEQLAHGASRGGGQLFLDVRRQP